MGAEIKREDIRRGQILEDDWVGVRLVLPYASPCGGILIKCKMRPQKPSQLAEIPSTNGYRGELGGRTLAESSFTGKLPRRMSPRLIFATILPL